MLGAESSLKRAYESTDALTRLVSPHTQASPGTLYRMMCDTLGPAKLRAEDGPEAAGLDEDASAPHGRSDLTGARAGDSDQERGRWRA